MPWPVNSGTTEQTVNGAHQPAAVTGIGTLASLCDHLFGTWNGADQLRNRVRWTFLVQKAENDANGGLGRGFVHANSGDDPLDKLVHVGRSPVLHAVSRQAMPVASRLFKLNCRARPCVNRESCDLPACIR